MTKTLTINKTKLARLILIGFVSLFFVAGTIFAQNPAPAASVAPTASLNFPIKELGDCKDIGSCTNYCNDPVNQNACTDFAKKQGFYKDDVTTYADDKFYKEAKDQLGCDSNSTCADFCSKSENFDACNSFAKTNEIPGGYTDEPDKAEYIEAAKATLGCDSANSCSTFCDNSANAQKCTEFAGQVGLLGGTVTEGPGGCQTPDTCGAYCSDPANYAACSAAAPAGGNFAGPGGCSSTGSCQSYCDQNPESCRSYAPGSNGLYVPVACPSGEYHGPGGACTAVADTAKAASCVGSDKYWDGAVCQDQAPVGIAPEVLAAHFETRPEMGNCTTPGECYDYCKENPASCPGLDPNSERPTDNYTPYLYYTPGSEVTHAPVESMGGCTSPAGCFDYCVDNKSSSECSGFNAEAPRPPEVYIPGTYYTPPADIVYVTPSTTNFYTTPIYYTPPAGSSYATPQYYTPGMYSTPSYYTPAEGSNYATPTYYTPGSNYATPTGAYPTPTYVTPTYYTPPTITNYTTPYYYTPSMYTTPFYYTPRGGSDYTTPTYTTPPPYTSPQYFTPYNYGSKEYPTPKYYTPITYNTPIYSTPGDGKYTTPEYFTPPPPYITPRYYTPWEYPTPPPYLTPPPYTTPRYPTPYDPKYPTPPYYTPPTYPTPPNYQTPPTYPTYPSPNYPYPTPGRDYASPTGGPNGGYSYPTPGTSYYSPPGTGAYYTPPGSYPTPPNYQTPPTYPTPPTYNTPPTYPTPPTYSTPPAYETPTYSTPPAYSSPSYGTPATYATPGSVGGVSKKANLLDQAGYFIKGLFGN